MPLTVGVNSYIDRAGAEAFFGDGVMPPAWAAASDADKDGALVQATRRIDRLEFVGKKADDLQPLQFPRSYPIGIYRQTALERLPEDGLLATHSDIEYETEGAVPEVVLDAVCEEAAAILKNAGSAQAEMRSRLQRQGVTSVKIGSVAETFDGSGQKMALSSLEAYDLLDNYLSGGGGFG